MSKSKKRTNCWNLIPGKKYNLIYCGCDSSKFDPYYTEFIAEGIQDNPYQKIQEILSESQLYILNDTRTLLGEYDGLYALREKHEKEPDEYSELSKRLLKETIDLVEQTGMRLLIGSFKHVYYLAGFINEITQYSIFILAYDCPPEFDKKISEESVKFYVTRDPNDGFIRLHRAKPYFEPKYNEWMVGSSEDIQYEGFPVDNIEKLPENIQNMKSHEHNIIYLTPEEFKDITEEPDYVVSEWFEPVEEIYKYVEDLKYD